MSFTSQLLEEYRRAKRRENSGPMPALPTGGIEYSAKTVMDFFPSALRVGTSVKDITVNKNKVVKSTR